VNEQRVCIIRRAYYPAESHVRRNAETLVASGYAVDVVCLKGQGEVPHEIIDGVMVYRLPLRTHRSGLLRYFFEYVSFFLLSLLKVSRLHVQHCYTVVEADSMPDFLVFAAFLPRLTGARLILYLFESMPEMWAQRLRAPTENWTVRLLSLQETMSCGFADIVICCHEMARDALVRRGIPEHKIIVILNVPDEQVFRQGICNHAPDDGLFRLIQHGTITENYGIQVVLQALKLLNPKLPILFDIVGDGEYRPVLESRVDELDLQGRVTFHGFVSRERLLELLCRANVGVVPMLFEYQSPNKMFEFVALGKPVITSDRQTFLQHFNEHEVLYFSTGDAHDLARAVQEAFNCPERMKIQAGRATKRYESYRWQEMSKRYLGIYEKLFANRKAQL
jgi:glycosyltransferase involved in cell wall biosynthesis